MSTGSGGAGATPSKKKSSQNDAKSPAKPQPAPSTPKAPSQSFGKIDNAQIEKAAVALQKHEALSLKAANKQQLFETNHLIYLNVVLNSVPPAKKAKPYLIPLKHSLYTDSEMCVFVRDPAKTYKRLIKDADLPNVKKVMGVTKLRNEWGQFEARRKLLNSYDLFVCDDAISLVLTRFLGKQFITTKKFPLGVKMGPGHNIGTQISKVRDSAAFYLTAGTVQSIPIARSSFTPAQIAENIQSAITNIVTHIPQKWLNVRQISIRTANSVALPIYTAVPTRPATLKAAALGDKKARMEKKTQKSTPPVAAPASAPLSPKPAPKPANVSPKPAKSGASSATVPKQVNSDAAVSAKSEKAKKRTPEQPEPTGTPSPKKSKVDTKPPTSPKASKTKSPRAAAKKQSPKPKSK